MYRRLIPRWLRAIALAWFTAFIAAFTWVALVPAAKPLGLGVAVIVYVAALAATRWAD